MKNLKKSILFLLIFFILFVIMLNILWLPETSITYFYKEPKNSLDVVYIGGSNVYVHFNSPLAYKEFGFTTGILAAGSQPFPLAKYLIKEAQKYQKPKLYVIDIARAADDVFYDGSIRETIDSMKFSQNRMDAINAVLDYVNSDENDEFNIDKSKYVNYYYSILKYHNVYKSLTRAHIFGNKDLYKGYFFTVDQSRVKAQDEYDWIKDTKELSLEKEKVILDLLDYIKNNNLNVLFVIPARVFDEETIKGLNKVVSIIDKYGYKTINFNTLSDFHVDFSKDFYHYAHLNINGSTKYTLYFAEYLNKNYNFIDHRNDKKYSSWDKEFERFKNKYQSIVGKNFDDLLANLKSSESN